LLLLASCAGTTLSGTGEVLDTVRIAAMAADELPTDAAVEVALFVTGKTHNPAGQRDGYIGST